jgi:hypothetical protein
MRFLLHATKKKSTASKQLTARRIKNQSILDQSTSRSWGQQCSPQCGCVLRFECSTDGAGTITAATYHAKQLVTNGRLQPISEKPLFVQSPCTTLHTLAQQVVDHACMQNRHMSNLQQATEFTSVRSSLAVQHAVLATHQLTPTSTGCFDLVEDAFVAMTKGFLPKPRRSTMTFAQAVAHAYRPMTKHDEVEEEVTTRYGRALRRFGRDTSLPITTPRSMSALTMFDLNFSEMEQDEGKDVPAKKMDWETYVDALRHEDQMA